MKVHSLLLGALLFLPCSVEAADWVITAKKGTVTADKIFADPQTVAHRGIDWGPWTALEAVEDPPSTPTAGKKFVSPSHQYVVRTSIIDREFYVFIQDSKSGTISRLLLENFPVLALAWSPDSKTILAVIHAPMTSFITFIHLNGSTWEQLPIDPTFSEGDGRYHVIGWEFKPTYIQVTYIVDHRTSSGQPLNLYKCTFRIDPRNGNTSNTLKTPISQKEYVSLRSNSN